MITQLFKYIVKLTLKVIITLVVTLLISISVTLFAVKVLPITYTMEIGAFDSTTIEYKYEPLMFVLDTLADDNDTVIININSVGGEVFLATDIASSIYKSEAHVITHNTNMAYSAGGFIGMLGDTISCDEFSTYLFHKARYFVYGKAIIVNDGPAAIVVQKLYSEYVLPMLTPEEIVTYETGGDVTILGTDLIERVGKLWPEKL